MIVVYRVDYDGFKAGDTREVDAALGCRLQGETVVNIIDRGKSTAKSSAMRETVESKVMNKKLENKNHESRR